VIRDIKDVPKTGSCVKIARRSPANDDSAGVLLRYGKDFTCVKTYQDFVFWGYEFISHADISTISLDDRERLHTIAERESWSEIDDGYEFVNEVDTWNQLVKALFNRGSYASFEHEDGTMYLGRIVTLSESKVTLICIDRQFEHETDVTHQSYNDLTAIAVGSPYVEFYATHSN